MKQLLIFISIIGSLATQAQFKVGSDAGIYQYHGKHRYYAKPTYTSADSLAFQHRKEFIDSCAALAARISGGGSSYTFSTGLTNSSGTITNNLLTGKSGGQTLIGGTGAGDNLTISTTSNGTKGKIIFGTNSVFDEVNNRFGVGTLFPVYRFDVSGKANFNSGVGGGWLFDDDGSYSRLFLSAPAYAQTGGVNSGFGFGISTFVNITAADVSTFRVNGGSIVNAAGESSHMTLTGGFASSSGSSNQDCFLISPTINNTGTYSAVNRGVYYNPTLTSLTGTTHVAWENTTGNMLFGTTSGQVGIGLTSPTAYLHIKANTSSIAQLRLQSSAGTNVSSPNNGDLWWNGTNLNFRTGSSTVDLLAGGGGSGTDSLNHEYVGTPGVPTTYARDSTLLSAYIRGQLSIDISAGPDSTVNVKLLHDSAAGPNMIYSTNSSSRPGWYQGPVSGTYTPTVSAISNVASNTPVLCHYTRIGNEVTVTGRLAYSATASSTFTSFSVSLPIYSTISANEDLSGIANDLGGSSGGAGRIFGDTINHNATLGFVSSTTSSTTVYFMFTYTID